MPPILVGVSAAVAGAQAVAINIATSLVPKSWVWATNPLLVWLLACGLTVSAAGMGIIAMRSSQREQIRQEISYLKDRFIIRHNFNIQGPFVLERDQSKWPTPSSSIRWALMYELENSGDRLISLLDVELEFPIQKLNGKHDTQLVRTASADRLTVFENLSAWAKAGEIKDRNEQSDYYFEREQDLPIHLQPGSRRIVVFEQEFELRVAGRALAFENDEQLGLCLAGYFQLIDTPGVILPKVFLIPTTIRTLNGEFSRDIAHFLAVVGTRIIFPDPGKLKSLLSTRKLGHLGQPEIYPNVESNE
ncbi:hypothetical protein [Amycolatopsis sp. NPDC051061]|uniref:hypothetical protein n=1 Tax=Amycolatopsis sp. NPDC051061 TaxID=3155042 RepID=UPI0034476568